MADTIARQRAQIGPQDDGRRMSLEEFRDMPGEPGYRYELGRGVVQVAPIPNLSHGLIIQAIDEQIYAWRGTHPGVVSYYAGGEGAKVELPVLVSERHPDRSIYATPAPPDEQPWDRWTPSITIEVVSPRPDAAQRDYVEKREEYLALGVLEYWIVDPQERGMLALTRHGDRWREHKLAADGKWTTPLLPGFTLDLAHVFSVLDRPAAS